MWGGSQFGGLPTRTKGANMATGTPSRPSPLDRLTKATARHTTYVEIPLDEETARAFATAQATVELLESADKKSAAAKAARLEMDKARAAMEEAGVIRFRVRSLGRKAWEELIEAHPPTPEQAAEAAPDLLGWNPETFPVAALAACVAVVDEGEPVDLTEEQAAELWNDGLNKGEAINIINRVVEINSRNRVVQVGKG